MEIEKLLSDVGLKCTRQRITVMKILHDASEPLTAESIFEKADGISLSTVYRIVEKLCEKGVVNKNTIRDSDRLYYEMAGHKHHAICLGCKSMKYVDVCPVQPSDIDNFTVTGHKLEIYGYCDKCRDKING